MNGFRRLVVVLFHLYFGVTSWGCATSNPRVAMVVGNGQYQHATPLPTPANDAQTLGDRLTELGWHVTTAIDVSAQAFEEARSSFESQIGNAEQAIFYYAGHSMQINGENYIVPIEFDPKDARLERDLISLNEAVNGFARGSGQLAVVLDACRDNPVAIEYEQAAQRARRGAAPSDGRGEPTQLEFASGLAEMPARPGMFIAYATQPGHVALDGRGRHSSFTRALLEYMDLTNLDVASVLSLVRNQVVLDTAGTQVPWDHSSLTKTFSINAGPESAPLR